MAAAQNIYSIESPRVLLQLVEKGVSRVEAQPEFGEASSRRSSKGLMTNQAPRFIQQPVNNYTPSSDYSDILIAYMNSVLNLSITLASDQAKISQMQTSNSQAFVDGAKAAAERMIQDLQAAIAEQEKQAHESKWQQILGYIGAGLMVVASILTVQPELALMAGLMLTDMMTGASDKLNDAIANSMSNVPSWLRSSLTIVTKVAIALAMAIVVGGISGAIRAGLERAAVAAAADAAAAGAGAANGAAAAANDESFLQRVWKNGFENGKGPGGYGQLASTTTQMMLFVNPFTDMLQPAIDQLPLSDETKKMLGKMVGMIMAMAMMAYMGRYTGLAGSANFADLLAQKVGQTGFNTLKFGVGMASMGAQIGQGALGVEQGESLMAQAAATKDLAVAQSLQTIFSGLLTQLNQLIQQSQAASKSVNDTIAAMNERWDSYVEPYRISADIAG